MKADKIHRILKISEKLAAGETVSKSRLAEEFGVTEKSIQRDIEDLRAYYSDRDYSEIVYSAEKRGYFLDEDRNKYLSDKEILSICKIILESRAFSKKEMEGLLDKMSENLSAENRSFVKEIVKNEKHNYVPLKHNKDLLDRIWGISRHIFNREVINIKYKRMDSILKQYDVKPVSIMFSEYYFYLIAYMCEKKDDYPTIFRIDRIIETVSGKKRFSIPYRDRFEDGEFRKRVQFMYGGKLCKVKFEYTGIIEYVLDRLPTARILSQNGDKYVVSVEIYGRTGIEMWLRSQGEKVKML